MANSGTTTVSPDLRPYEGLFGRMSELTSVAAAEERRSFLKFLDEYRADKETHFQLRFRLTDILQTVERWGLIGCVLCFVSTGEPDPDHEMSSCHRGFDRDKARDILPWLESLDIPRSCSRSRGYCSMCAAFHPCDDVVIGCRIFEANSAGKKDYWIRQYESKPGPDGHCQRKPIIRQVVAVLCTYDDQFLGKLIAKMALDRDGADLRAEQEARNWFEKRITFRDDWFPMMLLVYETLVLAFHHHRNHLRHLSPLHGFPLQPAGLARLPTPEDSSITDVCQWDNLEELRNWEASLDWWVDKCGFCAGRGLRGSHIQHSLRQCHQGGMQKVDSELAEAMYEEGMLPSNGCRICRLPYDLCDRWARDENGDWVPADEPRKCHYDRYLLSDTIIGLFHCGKGEFKDEILERVEEYCESQGLTVAFDEETVACCLSEDVTVAGVCGSEMVRELGILTKMVWHVSGDGSQCTI